MPPRKNVLVTRPGVGISRAARGRALFAMLLKGELIVRDVEPVAISRTGAARTQAQLQPA